VSGLKIDYDRVSTDAQDLTAQRDALQARGVQPERIYVDHGLTGTHRDRPGLWQALAAYRAGDELVMTKLDRLARSLPDVRAIADELTAREVTLALGTSVHDPTDPVGRLLFNVLAMVAEFEAGLIRAHARRHEGGQSQGAPARQAAQAQPGAGGAPGVPVRMVSDWQAAAKKSGASVTPGRA
jgi:DNA invertase Pin-like site-specific DNA recombinase